eukprot:jgi/Psemu1/29697/gm1.29697_g
MMIIWLEDKLKVTSKTMGATMGELQKFGVKQLTDILSTKKHKAQAYCTEGNEMVSTFNASVLEAPSLLTPVTVGESEPPEWERALSAQVAALQAAAHAKTDSITITTFTGSDPRLARTWKQLKFYCYQCGVNLSHHTPQCPLCKSSWDFNNNTPLKKILSCTQICTIPDPDSLNKQEAKDSPSKLKRAKEIQSIPGITG